MIRLFLKRFSKTPDGTWGVLCSADHHPMFFTAEIPDTFLRPGLYTCKLQIHYGRNKSYPAYEIMGVEGHTDVEIHIANVPARDLRGCVAVGMQAEKRGDWGVWLSGIAHEALLRYLDRAEFFELEITG
jgi:hypothetical protein